ncbi:hypothetical protein BVRB_042830, partial [Beta vulgaris subsp. vulgaris]
MPPILPSFWLLRKPGTCPSRLPLTGSIRPCYRIAFSDVRVRYVDPDCEGPVSALNGVLVGLCVERDPNDPYPQCIGLGLIRAIDPESHLFYVTTRVPQKHLSDVTCLMRGRLQVPAVLLFQ